MPILVRVLCNMLDFDVHVCDMFELCVVYLFVID